MIPRAQSKKTLNLEMSSSAALNLTSLRWSGAQKGSFPTVGIKLQSRAHYKLQKPLKSANRLIYSYW